MGRACQSRQLWAVGSAANSAAFRNWGPLGQDYQYPFAYQPEAADTLRPDLFGPSNTLTVQQPPQRQMASSDYLDNTPERGGKLDVIVTRVPSSVPSGFIAVLFCYSILGWIIGRRRTSVAQGVGSYGIPIRQMRAAMWVAWCLWVHLQIGQHRAKSVRRSAEGLARGANGQSERPAERGIGRNSYVPYARERRPR